MDISEVFHDEDIHEHSESALKMLNPFRIGSIVDDDTNENILPIPTKENTKYPLITNETIQYKNFQINLNKGLIAQVFYLSKPDYEEFIDNPLHLPYCRLYENPLLELITRNKWFYIPLIWGIVVMYNLYNGVFYNYEENISVFKDYVYIDGLFFSYLHVIFAIICGIIFWTKTEYLLHRFLFHCEWWLPNNRILLHLHFLLHGVHHSIPMDPYINLLLYIYNIYIYRDRLVFPPVLGFIIYTLIFKMVNYVITGNIMRLFMGGFLIGYIIYDMTHYYIHHGSPKSGHFYEMKTYHNKHHYKKSYKGYGISSKFWDYVYGTQID